MIRTDGKRTVAEPAPAKLDREAIVERLRSLARPGQTAMINGVPVKREAFRFRVLVSHVAYSTTDAATLIEQDTRS